MIYVKPPFRRPKQVFEYLSRYTHRIAIGDSRILAFDGMQVRIRCRKPKRPGQTKPGYGTFTLTAEEFIDRFLLHVHPAGMQRICHFGILADNCLAGTLQQARDALGIADLPATDQISTDGDSDSEGDDVAPVACPHCGDVLGKVAPIPKPQRRAYKPRAPRPVRHWPRGQFLDSTQEIHAGAKEPNSPVCAWPEQDAGFGGKCAPSFRSGDHHPPPRMAVVRGLHRQDPKNFCPTGHVVPKGMCG